MDRQAWRFLLRRLTICLVKGHRWHFESGPLVDANPNKQPWYWCERCQTRVPHDGGWWPGGTDGH
jgi:hypothetical protein